MSLELSKAYTEVYDILKYIDKSYIDKIPKSFFLLLKKKKTIVMCQILIQILH